MMRRAMFVGCSRLGVPCAVPLMRTAMYGAFTGTPKGPKDLQFLLASGAGVAGAGAGVGSLLIIFGPLFKIFPFWVPMVGAFVPLLWLSVAPPAYPNLKLALFLLFCFLEGMAMSASNTPD